MLTVWVQGHLIMPSVKRFFWVALLTSLLPFVPVCLSSVSDPCPYPSCLCLPLRLPFFLDLFTFKVDVARHQALS